MLKIRLPRPIDESPVTALAPIEAPEKKLTPRSPIEVVQWQCPECFDTYLRRYIVSALLGVAADEDLDEDTRDGAGNGVLAPEVHDGMRDAKSIGELSKTMGALSKEEKARYADYFNQRMQELREASRAQEAT